MRLLRGSYAIKQYWRAPAIVSSNLAIGTASVFVLASAAIGLLADRGVAQGGMVHAAAGAPPAWPLRGTLGPALGRRATCKPETGDRSPSFVGVARNLVVFPTETAKVCTKGA